MIDIGIVMGSDSDLTIMSEAAKMLDKLGLSYDISIVSAHRTPLRLFQYAKTARERGLKVIIAGAGGAAHLPGMVASISTLPVIGVPIRTSSLDGLDSLYSIVQMPAGVPVATMAINGAKNAAILAAQILAVSSNDIHDKIIEYKKEIEQDVENKNNSLSLGWFEGSR